ncbi:MAG: hypothetical protein QNJ72_38575 [Pleurocapsa sp. MO_226.B13]|nr:hypothetical protein [Pleurocapsa sp. MO_226.B13]
MHSKLVGDVIGDRHLRDGEGICATPKNGSVVKEVKNLRHCHESNLTK